MRVAWLRISTISEIDDRTFLLFYPEKIPISNSPFDGFDENRVGEK